MKFLIVICGHNGAGKSSIAEKLNLDGNGFKLINPDIIATSIRKDNPDYTEKRVQFYAGRIAIKERNCALEGNDNICIETTLSGKSEIDFIKRAKEKGFHIVAHYIGLESAFISQERVSKRVAEGGHDVPSESIKRRYSRSLENLTILSSVADFIIAADNTTSSYEKAFLIEDGDLTIYDEKSYLCKRIPKIFKNDNK